NASHEMQPHDVVAFKTYNSEFDRLKEDLNERDIPINKLRFLGLLKEARKESPRDIIVRKLFEKSGIWPLNPAKISRMHLAPTD
ncbi:hypothetical protein FA10DRAFT_224238, partial [Acaromyces ingoldii]